MSPNADLAGIDTSSYDFCDIKSVLDSIGICTKRFNSDQIANNNGLKLIECCRTFGLRIVNGRFGDAKNIGKFTYYYNKNGGKSVVDYIIMSDALLPLISAFEVDLFDDCMSDVHCPINLCLRHADDKCINVKKQATVKPQEVSTCTKENENSSYAISFRWDNEKASNFTNCFDSTAIKDLKNELINLNINASQSKIDLFCEKLCNIFIENATNVGACKVNKNTNKKNNGKKSQKANLSKPWFDKECIKRREEYYRVKKQLKKVNGSEKNMNLECKNYKKILKTKSKNYHKDFNKKLKKSQATPKNTGTF